MEAALWARAACAAPAERSAGPRARPALAEPHLRTSHFSLFSVSSSSLTVTQDLLFWIFLWSFQATELSWEGM